MVTWRKRRGMPAPSIDPGDLLDLKLMPAWVKEPSAREDYAAYEGEQGLERPERPRPGSRSRERTGRERRGRDQRPGGREGKRSHQEQRGPDRNKRRELPGRQPRPAEPEQPLAVRFRRRLAQALY